MRLRRGGRPGGSPRRRQPLRAGGQWAGSPAATGPAPQEATNDTRHRHHRHQRKNHDQGTDGCRAEPPLQDALHRRQPEQPHRRAPHPAAPKGRTSACHHRNGSQPPGRYTPAGRHCRARLRHRHQHRESSPGGLRLARRGDKDERRAVRLPAYSGRGDGLCVERPGHTVSNGPGTEASKLRDVQRPVHRRTGKKLLAVPVRGMERSGRGTGARGADPAHRRLQPAQRAAR